MSEIMSLDNQEKFITPGFKHYLKDILYYEEMLGNSPSEALSVIEKNIPDDVRKNFDCVRLYVGQLPGHPKYPTMGFRKAEFIMLIQDEIVRQNLDFSLDNLGELRVWDEARILVNDIDTRPEISKSRTLLFRFEPNE